MKISKLEGILAVLTAAALAFFAGWYLGAGSGGTPYTVTAERAGGIMLPAAETENPAPGLLEGEIININTAAAADLERLPGIGKQRAQDIVDYRETHGRFGTVEELTNISGIGEGTLQGLIDYVTVGED